jgi:FtsH-binding integral membrane protein
MFVGLVITSVIAITTTVEAVIINNPGLMFGALIAELALVFVLSLAINRLSPTVASVMFVAYAALNGFTLSLLVYSYTSASVVAAFVATAGIFAVMSVFAFTTTVDLLQYRTYFIVALIGLVIASLVNFFLRSDGFTTLISFAGVLIFTGLAAYDTQKLKYLAASPEFQADGSATTRYSIFMALQLYLDFINIFIFLLRLFGSRRD